MMTTDSIVQEDGFGFAPGSSGTQDENSFEIVRRYTLTNKSGASVRLITWGAGIQSIRIPNDKGVLGDVALGFDNIDGYLKNGRIGRITNRSTIGVRLSGNATGRNSDKVFSVDEGLNGLDSVNWQSYVLGSQVIMSHVGSREGKPANMLIQAKYNWSDDNELDVNICATATEPTLVNITNYCPLNLAGHGMGAEELKNHVVTINANEWISSSLKRGVRTVSRRKVEGTVFDLRNPTRLRNRLHTIPGGGYDHNLCINRPSRCCYRFHGRVLHPGSGRFLEIYSDQPGLHFNTENKLPDPEWKYLPDLEDHMWCGCGQVSAGQPQTVEKEPEQKVEEIRGKDGVLYSRQGGFVLSPQSSPARVLYPGNLFEHNMTYKFGVRSKND